MNYTEAMIHALLIEAEAIRVDVIAMQANDRNGMSTYTEEAYLACSNRLKDISKSVCNLGNALHVNSGVPHG